MFSAWDCAVPFQGRRAAMSGMPTIDRQRSVAEFLFVLATSLVLMLLLLARTELVTPDSPEFAVPRDLQQYIHMALNGVFDHHIAPYGWRIGTPLLVSWAPLDYVDAFFLISFISLWLTAAVIYYLVREFSFPRGIALAALVAFLSVGWAVKYNLSVFWNTEPPAFLLLTLGMLLLARGRLVAVSGLMAVGALFRETGLVLAPLVYTMRATRLIDVRAAVQAFAVLLPALLVLVGLRLLIPAWNEDLDYVATLPPAVQSVVASAVPTYDLVAVMQRSVDIRLGILSGPETLPYLFKLTFNVYGVPLTILAIIGAFADPRLLARVGLMLLIPYVQLFLATNSERLFVVGFPAALLLAAAGAAFLMKRLGISYLPFLVAALVLFGFGLITDRAVPQAAVQAGLFVLSALLIAGWARFLRAQQPAASDAA